MKDTSWKKVGAWYSKITRDGGHYYHTHVVMPGVLKLLELTPTSSLLDLACGSGVLAHNIPPIARYHGVDLAPNLIEDAQKRIQKPYITFTVGDVTKPMAIEGLFSHASCILAAQNMEHPEGMFENAAKALESKGSLVVVLNHPAFRIPRQSSWGTDDANKLQFRRINRYMSPLEIPITAHPGQKSSPVTWSYHLPLSAYFRMLKSAGLVVDILEEWTSDRESQGKAKKQENRAREEFPLFLAIRARKCML